MQVSIENVVNQFRALNADGGVSPETMTRIVEAVMCALRQDEQHKGRIEEEGSMLNYQQRSRRDGQ